MNVTTIDSNHADRDLRTETAIVGKYRGIARQQTARTRAYAAAIALNAAA